LALRDPEVLVGSFDRPNLTYRVEQRRDLESQVREVLDRHKGQSGIIYCIARADVDSLSAVLNAMGRKTLPYHAGMADDDRKRNQEAFIEDRVETIVATIAFGMGIDKPDVRYVIHAAMPKSLEHYQQESGRAGRDGLEAECCLFYSGGDYHTWKRMIDNQPAVSHPMAVASLNAMRDYCSAVTCRHRALVNHFGQDLEADCGSACDVCQGELDLVEDALVVGQKVLSSVYRQGQRFGTDYTAKVLAGSEDQRVLANGHDRLSTYGLLKEAGQPTIMQWIGQLVGQEFLVKDGEYSILKITDKGWSLLKGGETPRLLRPKRKTKKVKEARAKQQYDVSSWDGVDRELFEQLRTLRARKAAALGMPPYIVFSDVSLRDMARRRPSTTNGFRDVYGVGARKSEQYGAEFVGAIAGYCRDRGVTMDVPPPVGSPATMRSAVRPGGKEQAGPLFEQGASIESAMERLGRARSTVVGYLVEWLRERGLDDSSPWIDADTVRRVEAAIEAVGAERLTPIFQHLEGTVDYERIRIVVACWSNRQREQHEPTSGSESG
jgi:ATP-dependent DNA helicase RecQ